MTAPPSSPQPPLDELPRVQRFLERAAPLFLDHRQLDQEAWAALRDLARQHGLTDEELESVVKTLQRRGVIAQPKAPTDSREIEIDEDESNADLLLETTPPPAPPPVAPPSARPTALSSSRWAESDERKLFSTFLDRARPILADRRGLDATTYAMLADIAHSLGLSENQFDEAIHVLC